MKLLLTGARGFIGSYFQKNYSDKYDIETFSFQNDKLDNLDMTNIDVVLHLSALVHQMGGATKEEYWRINVNNTLALAKKAKRDGVKQFIFMSSVKVYGEENETAYTEFTECKPLDDYGRSKLEAEKRLEELQDDKFTASILRTPIVYGKGVKANIQNLVKLVEKVPILPFGGIQNRRSMVYIGNLCDTIDRIFETDRSGIFLAGDDHPVSTTELIEMIAEAKSKKVSLIHIPLFATLLRTLKADYHKRLFGNLEIDNTQTKKILHFSNRFDTKEGIRRMLETQ